MLNMQKTGGGVAVMLACAVLLAGCASKTEKRRTPMLEDIKGLKGYVEQVTFTESDRKLDNPNRGFYQLYEFKITDEGMDYQEYIREWYPKIADISLMFIQVNLQEYSKGAITQKGLRQIEELFSVLETYEKQLIIRFVYDREGNIEQYEPESLETILEHMEQLEPTLRKHSRQIFVIQGVFTGNWGEMNGSRYDTEENWKILAGKLSEITEDSIYLAVRTPAQWRSLVGPDQVPEGELPFVSQAVVTDEDIGDRPYESLWGRLGLFNDGMIGNESDYGTYGVKPAGDSLWSEAWQREDELAFQKALCRLVPNGGETITDNPYNDLPGALDDLAAMHVTYLNKWYDPAVLEKWADITIEEEGCFDGIDGYTYIERHLGYRLLIDSVQIKYRGRKKILSVEIRMKNRGFAPIYKAPELKLFLQKEGSEEEPLVYDMDGELSRLAGGDESETLLSLQKELDLDEFPKGVYKICFAVIDPDSRRNIQMANEQNPGAWGYHLGTVELKPLELPIP